MSRDETVKPHDEVVYLAAGVADAVLDGARSVLRRLPGLGEVRRELRARGELAWARTAARSEPHMEVLARRAGERGVPGERGGRGDRGAAHDRTR
ncbi:hypothetical protein ABT299_00820 [Spirillospora sp. NPDC000708]|jgi:hypothetical protein|uniref:hypothetical protein n=1 Tax=Actinomadura sp. RB99 TaxID=2691577 RepID=UPI001687CA34|nr:hypothetical protein [Actinomadura sp. RB99]MBD2891652.1 hypothetical protein [Actinomadura sp. RB99]